MKLVDLNLLLYAVNRDSPNHARAKAWLDHALSGDETVALPWIVVLGFLRVSTASRIMSRPLTVEQATAIVDSWLERHQVLLLDPADEHWRVLRDMLIEAGTAGNLTADAHLAALAMEHDAELCSTDGDFARFRRVRWRNPLT